MTTGERIKNRRNEISMSAETLAERIGVSRATVYRYEKGDIEKLPGDILQPLASALNTTPAFLMGWEEQSDCTLFDIDNIIPLPHTVRMPLLGTIACGEPILATENIDDYIYVPEMAKADFALRCKGDSMINARIFNDDIVCIRQQSDVNSGEIAAILIDDEATLKRVFKYPGKIVLHPENPMFKDLVFFGEELDEIRILGKAVMFISGIR